jgi:hypothetical protein
MILVELMDQTFASELGAMWGSECLIRSTSAPISNEPFSAEAHFAAR